MATIFDVADWFLSKDSMTHKKLQKLCYYYKAWGLALYGVDLLPNDEFQAWVHGPVCPALYQKYKGYGWNDIPRNEKALFLFNDKETEVLESVWITYGDMSPNALEAQTHVEEPWRKARIGCGEFEPCEKPIRNEDMRDYYKALYEAEQGE